MPLLLTISTLFADDSFPRQTWVGEYHAALHARKVTQAILKRWLNQTISHAFEVRSDLDSNIGR